MSKFRGKSHSPVTSSSAVPTAGSPWREPVPSPAGDLCRGTVPTLCSGSRGLWCVHAAAQGASALGAPAGRGDRRSGSGSVGVRVMVGVRAMVGVRVMVGVSPTEP